MARKQLLLCMIVALAQACGAEPSPPPVAAGGQDVSETSIVDAPLDGTPADAPADSETSAETDPGTDVSDALEPVDAPPETLPDTTTDGTETSAVPDAADAGDIAVDAPQPVSCTPGTKSCKGAKLLTCGTKGDGWIESNCFPGTTCVLQKEAAGLMAGVCKAVSNNLIIMFDSSGSMTVQVKKKNSNEYVCAAGSYNTWPTCEYDAAKFPMGCTRMGVSKWVFKQALAKIDTASTRIALFKFPQKVSNFGQSCANGAYSGVSFLDGEPIGAGAPQTIQPKPGATDYYWNNLAQTLCVPFPKDQVTVATLKADILKWMDGTEQQPNDPELRATGGTPIGKTLFYIGEYIRHVVVVDGKPCAVSADCGNVNYECVAGKCKDPSRSCRDTAVVLFTDGGESDDNTYFAPRVQAKRLAFGLGCDDDQDCVGGSVCQAFKACDKAQMYPDQMPLCTVDQDCAAPPFKGDKPMGACKSYKQCTPKESASGWRCTATNAPCFKGSAKGEPAYCDPGPVAKDSCVKEPYATITGIATVPAPQPQKLVSDHNVLRGWDGKPIGVTVHVVDIGSASANELANTMRLAMAGNGKLLGADASDPDQFLGQLDKAFDMKNKKICGQEF
jgi:hypothetical protein